MACITTNIQSQIHNSGRLDVSTLIQLSEDLLKLESSPEPEGSLELESLVEPESVRSKNLLELSENILFQKGKAYYSLEAFKYVVDQYSEAKGFKVIYNKDSNRSNGFCRTQVFTCDYYSQFKPKPKDPNKKNKNVESKKYSCPWVFTDVTNQRHSYCAAGALLQNKTHSNNDLPMADAICSILTDKHGTKYRFFDSKTILTDFLAVFEQAFGACKEAEDIFIYKELIYPSHSNSKNSIENQAANSSNNGLCCFKLSNYEKPDTICWVYYDGCTLTCSCHNLNESSSECVSKLQYMHINRLLGEIASKIAVDSDKYVDFTLYLEKYLEALYINTDNGSNSTYVENVTASLQLLAINNFPKSKAVEGQRKEESGPKKRIHL
ncbi:10803_t:CDS:2 [Cetraspora pellucida]|uniref:10803_t:CDS:1 n=1 Tax=Cetraspora pellucida TaxID=1433469 RepID=A0A9N9EB73_9GLOM|nr:10803_t:CDS:2 [Cetraspora pellucida]